MFSVQRTRNWGLNWWAGVLCAAACWPSLAQPVRFKSLGDLPGGGFRSSAYAASRTGDVVVGAGTPASGNSEPFRWTVETGMVGLGQLPGRLYGAAVDVSTSGDVVVGYSFTSSSGASGEAFRWTAGTGMVGLGDLPGGAFYSEARGVSADGSVVVGRGRRPDADEAFRWTAQTGMVGLGDLPGGFLYSAAWDASDDGNVVVGASSSSRGQVAEAFRWTPAGGMVGLGDLPGAQFFSVATAVSFDGNAIVGTGTSAAGLEAFRWTAATGMVGLGDLPGGEFYSTGQGASADGDVVVGWSKSQRGAEAFVWDASHGMRDLRKVLMEEYGMDLRLWTLTSAQGISPDGHVIVGVGVNPAGDQEAWLAILPEPSAAVTMLVAAALAALRRRR